MASTDSSRFKGFKFSSKPPPLPPKDPIYLRSNPSRSSLLSPPPDSPLSPSIQYAIRRANSPSPSPFSAEETSSTMNYSSPDLLASASYPQQQQPSTSYPSNNNGGPANRQTLPSKALAFLKFPKRSPRSPPALPSSSTSSSGSVIVIGNTDDPDPPPPQEDDGISLPWNFQHNIHVDEGYVGIPPSWSTSLASAGFTEEEIAAIQARRAAGVRSPPDLRYLYNERPRSPATVAFPQQQQVPVLTHPTPRTTSLPRQTGPAASQDPPPPLPFPLTHSQSHPPPSQRPTLPAIFTSAPTSSSSAPASASANLQPNTSTPTASNPNPNRIPPPKRKPPLPVEEVMASGSGSERGHRPNQASSSTVAYSAESHHGTSSSHNRTQTSTSFSGLNNSAAYNYNPSITHTRSKSNLAIEADAEDDDDKPLALSMRPNLNGTPSPGSQAGGSSRFRVVNGSSSKLAVEVDEANAIEQEPEKKEKKSIWGTKIPKSNPNSASASTSNLVGSVSDHSSSNHAGPSSLNSQQSGWLSPKSGTASASLSLAAASASAAASSSLAGVVRQGSSLVDAVRSSAGRGIGRIRSKGGIKEGASGKEGGLGKKVRSWRGKAGSKKGKEVVGEDGVLDLTGSRSRSRSRGRDKSRESESSDSEYSDVDGEGEGEGSDEEFASLPADDGGTKPVWQVYSRPRAGTDASARANAAGASASASASQHSLSQASTSRQTAQSQSQTNLARKPSLRSAASQGSLRSRLAKGLVQGNQSTGSVNSLGRSAGGHHKASGSVTSLESIPEAEGDAERQRGTGVQRSRSLGRNGSNKRKKDDAPPPSSYAWTPSPSTSPTKPSTSTPPSTTPAKKTAALPPRLSLHKSTDSTDLSSWSEALLSGISLSGDGGLGLSFGLGGGDSDKEKEKESPATASTVGGGMTARPWQRTVAPPVPVAAPAPSKPQQTVQPPPAQTTSSTPPILPPPQPQPAPAHTAPRLSHLRKSGQPLPTSKPPPQRPIPPIVIANPNGLNNNTTTNTFAPRPIPAALKNTINQRSRSNSRSGTPASMNSASGSGGSGRDSPAPMTGVAEPANTARLMPVTPGPPSASVGSAGLGSVFSPMSPSMNKPLPPLRSTTATPPLSLPNANAPVTRGQGQTTGAESLLSPPPTTNVLSPAGSSNGPDSAQLWNEIEQMMDPGMMSAIPGLHLSVALPPGAQGVLRSAGVITGGAAYPPPPPLNMAALGAQGGEMKTVGDLVGSSPTQPTYSAALAETFSPTLPFTPEEERMDAMRRLRASEVAKGGGARVGQQPGMGMEDEEEEDEGSDYGDDNSDGYEDLGPAQIHARPAPGRRDVIDSGLLSVHGDADDRLLDRDPNRDSSRSSSSTLTVTALAATTIVRNVSIARRTGAYVMEKRPGGGLSPASATSTPVELKHPPSPLSSHFGGSEESTGSGSGSGGSGSTSSSQEQEQHPTPTTDGGIASPLLYYLDGTQTPSPTPDKLAFPRDGAAATAAVRHRLPGPKEPLEMRGYEDEDEFEGYPDEETMEAEAEAAATASRPTIVIFDDPLPSPGPVTMLDGTPGTATPLSPFQRYRGWLSAVVAPLEEFIDDAVDPRDHYLDLREIAEGESGSVYAAMLNPATAHKLRLPPLVKAKDTDDVLNERQTMVAIKSVAIVPSGSPKLVDLQRELTLMRGLGHENVLGMDGVYVDLVEDSLWVRMELMERSLADIIGLVGDGLQLQERTIARFTSDVLCALDYLQKHNIAHRDVRSDNLLLNKHGELKLADFSNAVQVTPESSMRSDVAGVPFWQAPEVRKPPYDALKVDVWSLGATVWEMAQQDPPFADTQQLADRWPPLRQPELYSPAFHDFLRKCSEPAAVRPSPSELLKSSFIVHKACGRHVVVLLLSQCMAIEKLLLEGNPAS